LQRQHHNHLAYDQFDSFSQVRHGVFTRHGGVSAAPYGALNLGRTVGDDPEAVEENYRRVYAALGVEADRVCSVWQVHGVEVVTQPQPVPGQSWIAQADAMVTDQPGMPLVMRYADCTPILLHDPVMRVIGIAHAGWRGTVQGIASRTVQTMTGQYGCQPHDIRAGIGPSIGPDCYQVGEEVVTATEAYFGDTDGLIRRHPADNSAYLDLWAANALDLRRAGIQHIETAGICTMKHTQDFYSHRGEHGQTGRFAAVIVL